MRPPPRGPQTAVRTEYFGERVGGSLPPRVEGSAHGEIEVWLHPSTKFRFELRWWGEDGQGVQFEAGSSKMSRCLYPVRTDEASLSSYLRDMRWMRFDVLDDAGRLKGKVKVALTPALRVRAAKESVLLDKRVVALDSNNRQVKGSEVRVRVACRMGKHSKLVSALSTAPNSRDETREVAARLAKTKPKFYGEDVKMEEEDDTNPWAAGSSLLSARRHQKAQLQGAPAVEQDEEDEQDVEEQNEEAQKEQLREDKREAESQERHLDMEVLARLQREATALAEELNDDGELELLAEDDDRLVDELLSEEVVQEEKEPLVATVPVEEQRFVVLRIEDVVGINGVVRHRWSLPGTPLSRPGDDGRYESKLKPHEIWAADNADGRASSQIVEVWTGGRVNALCRLPPLSGNRIRCDARLRLVDPRTSLTVGSLRAAVLTGTPADIETALQDLKARRLVKLQACTRGYLVRHKSRSATSAPCMPHAAAPLPAAKHLLIPAAAPLPAAAPGEPAAAPLPAAAPGEPAAAPLPAAAPGEPAAAPRPTEGDVPTTPGPTRYIVEVQVAGTCEAFLKGSDDTGRSTTTGCFVKYELCDGSHSLWWDADSSLFNSRARHALSVANASAEDALFAGRDSILFKVTADDREYGLELRRQEWKTGAKYQTIALHPDMVLSVYLDVDSEKSVAVAPSPPSIPLVQHKPLLEVSPPAPKKRILRLRVERLRGLGTLLRSWRKQEPAEGVTFWAELAVSIIFQDGESHATVPLSRRECFRSQRFEFYPSSDDEILDLLDASLATTKPPSMLELSVALLGASAGDARARVDGPLGLSLATTSITFGPRDNLVRGWWPLLAGEDDLFGAPAYVHINVDWAEEDDGIQLRSRPHGAPQRCPADEDGDVCLDKSGQQQALQEEESHAPEPPEQQPPSIEEEAAPQPLVVPAASQQQQPARDEPRWWSPMSTWSSEACHVKISVVGGDSLRAPPFRERPRAGWRFFAHWRVVGNDVSSGRTGRAPGSRDSDGNYTVRWSDDDHTAVVRLPPGALATSALCFKVSSLDDEENAQASGSAVVDLGLLACGLTRLDGAYRLADDFCRDRGKLTLRIARSEAPTWPNESAQLVKPMWSTESEQQDVKPIWSTKSQQPVTPSLPESMPTLFEERSTKRAVELDQDDDMGLEAIPGIVQTLEGLRARLRGIQQPSSPSPASADIIPPSKDACLQTASLREEDAEDEQPAKRDACLQVREESLLVERVYSKEAVAQDAVAQDAIAQDESEAQAAAMAAMAMLADAAEKRALHDELLRATQAVALTERRLDAELAAAAVREAMALDMLRYTRRALAAENATAAALHSTSRAVAQAQEDASRAVMAARTHIDDSARTTNRADSRHVASRAAEAPRQPSETPPALSTDLPRAPMIDSTRISKKPPPAQPVVPPESLLEAPPRVLPTPSAPPRTRKQPRHLSPDVAFATAETARIARIMRGALAAPAPAPLPASTPQLSTRSAARVTTLMAATGRLSAAFPAAQLPPAYYLSQPLR